MITTLICDCDGVLNDGKQAHDINLEYHVNTSAGFSLGREIYLLKKPFKTFHSRDKTAIRELISKGIRVIITSADDNETTKTWVESCGAEFIYTPIVNGQKDISDLPVINWDTTVGIGDDVIDLSYLLKCEHRFCPKDASVRLSPYKITRLEIEGGKGIIDELLWKIEKQIEHKPAIQIANAG